MSFPFQVMAFTSLGVVLVSTLTFVLGTFPEFQPEDELGFPPEFPQAVLVMSVIDNIAVGFFLVEYVVSQSPRHQKLRPDVLFFLYGKFHACFLVILLNRTTPFPEILAT